MHFPLRAAARYAILKVEKGKAIEAATLRKSTLKALQHQPSTIRSSWRLLLFILENLIDQIHKGYNEYSNLD